MLSGVMLPLLSISPHAHTDGIIVYEQVFGIKLHSAIPRRKAPYYPSSQPRNFPETYLQTNVDG